MKQAFRSQKFRPDSLARIQQMIEIVEEYQEQGLRLTARQLFYQLVSRDYIPNTSKSYKNMTALLADARYAGYIDWDAIEDRVRQPTIWSDFNSMSECLEDAIRTFRLPRWDGQDSYVELWVEKEALAGILSPLASRYHATLLVNKGYSSASAMYEAAQRFKERSNQAESDVYDEDKPELKSVLFYLGDHDPSGEDMVRDIGDRLSEFGVERLKVQKLALTMDQVKKYKPPPNPAKESDIRYAGYVAEHGTTSSWEVDALPPNVLQQIIRTAFESVIDQDVMDEIVEREDEAKKKLRLALKKIDKENDDD